MSSYVAAYTGIAGSKSTTTMMILIILFNFINILLSDYERDLSITEKLTEQRVLSLKLLQLNLCQKMVRKL